MATQVGNVIFSISADLKNLQGQLRTMEGNFQSSFSKIENIAGSFGKGILQGLIGGLSVGAVTGFAHEILNLADSLQNLHEQTGVSVELLSGIKSPLEEAGTSVEAFAKGVFNLQKNLGNIDKATDPAAQAIKRLGLNIDDLRNSSPDDFIKKVTDALGQIENPVERNTVLFNLLGKSAKELGPALQQLAGRFDELKASGLTAADVKALDDVGDALTRLKNQALLLGAEGATALLRFFNIMRDAPKVAAQLDAATQRAAERFNLPKERIEGMTSNEIIRQAEVPTRSADLAGRRFARDELLNLREEFNKLNAVNVQKPAAVFKGISEGAKTAKKDVDNLADSFLNNLEKQLASIESKKIELRFGESAGLSASLDAQLAAFKENLQDKQLPIPKGLDEFFTSLKGRIVAANDELHKMQFEMARIDEAAKGASQDSAEWLTATEEMAKRAADSLAKLEPAFRDLQKNLSVEILPPDQQSAARVGQEFEDRVRAINEWRDAAISAGQDVETVNEQAAQATSDAWVAASQKMKDQADETSEFTRRAFERGFDAVSDGIKDVLDNGISSFTDFTEKIRKTINSLVADFLTQQLKDLFLGQEFGKKGAPIGGLLGNILGGNQAPQSNQLPGMTAADRLDAEFGQQLRELTSGEALSNQQFALSTATFSAAVQEFAAAVSAASATSATSSATGAAGSGIPFIGSFLGGSGGGASVGYGSAPSGVEGPSMANGGFFSTALGALMSYFGYHKGGLITEGGENASFKRVELIKMHSGGEVPIMARAKEYVFNEWSAASFGKPQMDWMNATGTYPPEARRSPTGDHNEFHFHGVQDADSFRRSRSQILADLTRAVHKGQKNL